MTHREATRDIRGVTIVEVTIFRLQLKGVAPGGFEKKAPAIQRGRSALRKTYRFSFLSLSFFFTADLHAAQCGPSSEADVSAASYFNDALAIIPEKECCKRENRLVCVGRYADWLKN